MEMLENLPEILEAILACVGGLKIISRYTPWQWDDKAFEKAEKPLRWAAAQAKRFWPKKKDDEKK